METTEINNKTTMVVDLSNVTWACYYAQKKDGFHRGLLAHSVLASIKSTFGQFDCDDILIACDSPNVWRKDVYPEYKANRDGDRDENFEAVREVMTDLREFFNTSTSIPAVSVDRCEADDIIAGLVRYVETYRPGDRVIIASADRDFIQLIGPNVRLYSPVQKKERTTDDPEFELFMKCIRGDPKDFIFSAYPRVRKTRLEKAYHDPVEMMNLMETTTKDGIDVGESYRFNRELIDLNRQPPEIRRAIEDEIREAEDGYARYNYLKVENFLSRYELRKVSDDLDNFKSLLKSGFTTDK